MEMENRCNFWLPKKNRYCANIPINDSLFCGNHKPGSEQVRIPCPIDPSHSILQENLDAHVKRCPLQKQVEALQLQPFYKKGVNSGIDDDSSKAGSIYKVEGQTSSDLTEANVSCTKACSKSSDVSSEMKRSAIYKMSTGEFSKLLTKIKSIYSSISSNICDSYAIPETCDIWIKRQADRKLPFQERHVLQQASILGNLEAFGILRKPSDLVDLEPKEHLCCNNSSRHQTRGPAVVEFGAGRGYLTHMLVDCYGIEKVFLVERKSYKLKADRTLRQKQHVMIERLRIDIEDLNLDAIKSLSEVQYLAIGKHLCGPATDKRYLSNLGITKDDFHAITWFTSWAVDADHGSDLSNSVNEGLRLENIEEKGSDKDISGVEEIVRNMKAVERAVLGLICKEIIDVGRLMWLIDNGLEAQLVKYVPSTISPENHLLLAKSNSHL